MSHIAKSKILEEIIIEIRKKGVAIPENIMNDLKAARTMMNLNNTGETEPKIDIYLENVEAYLINEASNYVAPEKVDDWFKKLETARCDSCVTIVEAKKESRFIPGVPRDQKWIRIQPTEKLHLAALKHMAIENKLSYREEKTGSLVVYGQPNDVRYFIKKMTQQTNE